MWLSMQRAYLQHGWIDSTKGPGNQYISPDRNSETSTTDITTLVDSYITLSIPYMISICMTDDVCV